MPWLTSLGATGASPTGLAEITLSHQAQTTISVGKWPGAPGRWQVFWSRIREISHSGPGSGWEPPLQPAASVRPAGTAGFVGLLGPGCRRERVQGPRR